MDVDVGGSLVVFGEILFCFFLLINCIIIVVVIRLDFL